MYYVAVLLDVNQITPSMLSCNPWAHLPTMQVHISIHLTQQLFHMTLFSSPIQQGDYVSMLWDFW
jgi:hypothetical protein